MVVELSRLGRNVGDLGRLIDDLDDKGASLRILNLARIFRGAASLDRLYVCVERCG